MKNFLRLRYFLVCLLVLPVAVSGADLPFVHGLFTDNAIMQREVRFPVWGWTTPGATVEVSMAGITNKAVAGADGKWMARLGPFKAGGPFTMTISGPQTVALKNILVGDVWLCSGQSNMQMGLGEVKNGQDEVANANHPQIRLYNVSRTMSPLPCPNVKSDWYECSPDSIRRLGTPEWGGFSALAYFFGREIHQEIGVPIGLINASVGATLIETWSGDRALRRVGGFDEALDAMQSTIDQTKSIHPPKAFVNDGNANHPTLLYNGMIAPLEPFAIKGALWYQAESNTENANQYAKLLTEMIADWRAGFGVGDFPFLIVQLPNIWKVLEYPSEAAWANLREAQLQVSQTVTNTGLAVTIDIGDPDNIHPKRKLEVGKRLALAALAKVYGRNIEYSGPIYRQMIHEGNRIRIKFDHVGGGLAVVGGDKLKTFAIAGKDGKFVWAQAVIDGADVVVWADQIPEPVSVRYAWAAYPDCNLFNKAGLPASPFRTDTLSPTR